MGLKHSPRAASSTFQDWHGTGTVCTDSCRPGLRAGLLGQFSLNAKVLELAGTPGSAHCQASVHAAIRWWLLSSAWQGKGETLRPESSFKLQNTSW